MENEIRKEEWKRLKTQTEIENGWNMEKKKGTILILRYYVIPTNDFRLLDSRIVSTS